ncbi:type IV secretory system conjugative DNA transfer family protein, partial [Frankia sp. CIT1]|uniref:type IV secretory system conjugative DNA transfer family protein n=1 Tax=Frankia sp. CIT1 TaxID=2880974 RepID=UPI001EF56DD6
RRQPGGWALAGPSLADDRDLAALTPAGATARARALRPSLAPLPRLSETDRGWPIGDLTPGGTPLYGSDEDVAIAVMAPRAGKTTALAVPVILDAPGAVVATANKADLWATTAALRAANGTVWVFDPQQIAYAPPIWWWNPLAAVRGVEDADRLASHFLQEIRGGQASRDFWAAAAGDLLASLLLAAATNGRSLIDVYEWLNDSASPRPADLLDDHGYRAVAAGLRGRQAGAPETREGVYETARAAARCLRNDQILTWVTPPADRRRHASAARRRPFRRQQRHVVPAVQGRRRRRQSAGRRLRRPGHARRGPPRRSRRRPPRPPHADHAG